MSAVCAAPGGGHTQYLQVKEGTAQFGYWAFPLFPPFVIHQCPGSDPLQA